MSSIVFQNALIRDETTKQSITTSIVVEDGIIKCVSDTPIIPYGCTVVDCKGKCLIPSFVDAHLHIPGDLLYQNYGLTLYDCCSPEDIVHKVEAYGEENKTNACIRGYGWTDAVFFENKGLYNSDYIINKLDSCFPSRPVVLFSGDYHSCICNSAALRLCGINIDSSDPQGGRIVRDINGKPNGILLERANHIIYNHPDLCFSKEELEHCILEYQEIVHRHGITTVQTLMFIGGDYDTEWEIVNKLNSGGKLKININGSIPIWPGISEDKIKEMYELSRKFENDKVMIRTAKIYIDGVIDNHTAYVYRPYKGTEDTGICFWDYDELCKVCEYAMKLGLQLHFHAIGDRAVSVAARAVAHSENKTGKKTYRNTIAHIQMCNIETIRLMAKYNIIACLQPYWFPASPYHFAVDKACIGKRADYEYRCASFHNNGVLISGGSDSPVTPDFCPTIAISYGATRMDSDYNWPIYNQVECVDPQVLIDAYTTNAAYQLFREKTICRIAPGYEANFVILSKDIYSESPSEIKRIRPLKTIYRGEIVFE